MDENSLENIPTISQSNLNSMNNLSNEGTLLQSVIDKNTIAEAQEIIANLQVDGQNNNEFNDIIKTDPDSCVSSSDDIDEFEEEMNSFSDGPMLPERDVIFNLQAPSFVPNYLNMHYVCETGSRILLLSICWFKKFHAFNLLRYLLFEFLIIFFLYQFNTNGIKLSSFSVSTQFKNPDTVITKLLGRIVFTRLCSIIAFSIDSDRNQLLGQLNRGCNSSRKDHTDQIEKTF